MVKVIDRPDMTIDVYRGRKTTMQHYTDIDVTQIRNIDVSRTYLPQNVPAEQGSSPP